MYNYPFEKDLVISIKPKYKDIVSILDMAIQKPHVYLQNTKDAQRLGIHLKELRTAGILHISTDDMLKESVISIKKGSFKSVNKCKNPYHRIEYVFKGVKPPKVDLPKKLNFLP